jgi:hypothetical protein
MGAQEFGEVIYLCTNIIVASYNSVTDTFGTPISLAVGQMLTVEPEADTDQLRTYGVVGDVLSVPTGAKITLGAGAIDRDALGAIGGAANYTSGLTPNRVVTTDWKMGEDGELPYFGAIGTARGTNGVLVAVGIQKAKLNVQPKYTLDGKENKFNLLEIEGYAAPVERSNIWMGVRTKTYETASDFTAPADATAFKAFFTSPAAV